MLIQQTATLLCQYLGTIKFDVLVFFAGFKLQRYFLDTLDVTLCFTKQCSHIHSHPFTALHHSQQHSAASCPAGEDV